MAYVATEPEEVTVFQDTKERSHSSRDDALRANFLYDLEDKMGHLGYSSDFFEEFVNFAECHKELVNILIVERDYT